MQNLKKKGVKATRLARRKVRIHNRIQASNPEFRVIINRSNLYLTAQVANQEGKILAHISDKGLTGATKTERAHEAGVQFAALLNKQNISTVAFDRNGYLYHGRVKAFAEGLRAGGMHV